MRKRTDNISNGDFFATHPIVSYYNEVKKTINDYVMELIRHNRYKSIVNQADDGYVLDDRGRLIDLYDSCLLQDAHLLGTIETLSSYLIGEQYMLARRSEGGKWKMDDDETAKIQGTQFEKIITGIMYAVFYGYTLIEIKQDIDPETGRLKEVNLIERRNVLPGQHRVVLREHEWDPGYDIDDKRFNKNYVLIDTGNLGLFSATTPLVLAKKFTIANWVNFAHTYGQPIIHGKTNAEDEASRKRLAGSIANAAQKKVLVTGKEDEVDVKTFVTSNSEQIYDKLKAHANSEISNLILGSESMAGATQSYVGSTKAHEDIFRARLKKYRRVIENYMNEKVIPVLKYWDVIDKDVWFKYRKRVEMSDENKIKLYDVLTNKYAVNPDVIEDEFGVVVGEQFNDMEAMFGAEGTTGLTADGESENDHHIMSDQEYLRRYGHPRGVKKSTSNKDNNKNTEEEVEEAEDRINFLRGMQG